MAEPASTVVAPAVRRDWLAELRLYRFIVSARIRSDWQYRTSFITLTLSQTAFNAVEFVAVLILFEVVPSIGGWSRAEVGLLYGLATVPFGIADVFVSTVERTAFYVRTGALDRVLLRPVSALLQIGALEFELRRVGKVLPSATVLVWALTAVDVAWVPWRVAVLVVALLSGTVIYSALWVLGGALSFWLVDAREATNAVTYGGQFANEYPLHLYRPWIRAVLGWILPLAFVAYVPAQAVLDAADPLGLPAWLVALCPLVACASAAVAVIAWRSGVRRYQSTGS